MKSTTRKSPNCKQTDRSIPFLNSTLAIAFTSLVALGISLIATSSEAVAPRVSKARDAIPGELIVKTRAASLSAFSAARAELTVRNVIAQTMGATSVRSVSGLAMDERIQKVTLTDASETAGAIATLRADPSIAYAEPNYIYRAFENPNDTDFAKQWDLVNVGQPDPKGQVGTPGADINVAPVWARGITGSRNVIVAVIDTGVDYTHPELAANVYTNAGESGDLATNGKDDDGNGVVDDLHGANFVAGTTGTNASIDDHNHGTHCSGTIGATGNNGAGISGVNWNVTILPVKFLSADGSGSLEGAVNAIKYATKMKANVMSNSWGGGGFSQAMQDAIQEAADHNILFVAAAGNDASNNDSGPSYPASYALPNVVSVAAIDNRDAIASFSNYGAKTVHVAAPGVNVYSTVKGGGYDTYSGTSMACPHVSGMAALLWSNEPGLTAVEVKERLIKTSTPIASLKRKVLAHGRVNMQNAIDNLIPPSDEPDESLWKDAEFVWESAHPYPNAASESKEVSFPGARYLRVVFEKVDLENRYDTVKLLNPQGVVIDTVTGAAENYVTEYTPGDKITLKFETDSSVNKWGFRIAKVQVIY